MKFLSFVLPTLLLAGLLLLSLHCFTVLRRGLHRSEGFPAPRTERRLTRADAFIAAILTLCYGVLAFVGLGDRTAPQSFCHFADYGNYALIELDGTCQPGSLMYYTGLHTGSYHVELSADGESFSRVAILEQSYADLFKWREAALDTLGVPAKYLRLISDAELELGELAVYDTAGKRISSETMRFDAGVAPLFDEQDSVPEAGPNYRNSAYFDEVYHPRTAYEHIRNVAPYEVSHPPLGKLILSLGIRLFGMTPFGWRFMGTLFGVLMLPILYIFLKKLFGSTAVAGLGTVLLAADFMHFAQTRLATIDTYAVFFILLMYLFMYLFISDDPDAPGFRPARQLRNLFLCGLSFGLGAASKWTCFYAGAGLALIWLLYWVRRSIRLRRSVRSAEFLPELSLNIGLCLIFFVLLPCLIYYLSYIPYGRAEGMSGLSMLLSRDYARIIVDNLGYMFRYHAGVDATHPYSSMWYHWLLDLKPILYYLDYPTESTRSSIAAFLNPIVCWGGLLALAGTVWLGWRRRDARALFLVLGYLAQLLPWIAVKRIVFAYHYFTCVPFLVLCICYVFDALRSVDPTWRKRLTHFALASVVLLALFYPALSGVEAPRWYYDHLLSWLPGWPL